MTDTQWQARPAAGAGDHLPGDGLRQRGPPARARCRHRQRRGAAARRTASRAGGSRRSRRQRAAPCRHDGSGRLGGGSRQPDAAPGGTIGGGTRASAQSGRGGRSRGEQGDATTGVGRARRRAARLPDPGPRCRRAGADSRRPRAGLPVRGEASVAERQPGRDPRRRRRRGPRRRAGDPGHSRRSRKGGPRADRDRGVRAGLGTEHRRTAHRRRARCHGDLRQARHAGWTDLRGDDARHAVPPGGASACDG